MFEKSKRLRIYVSLFKRGSKNVTVIERTFVIGQLRKLVFKFSWDFIGSPEDFVVVSIFLVMLAFRRFSIHEHIFWQWGQDWITQRPAILLHLMMIFLSLLFFFLKVSFGNKVRFIVIHFLFVPFHFFFFFLIFLVMRDRVKSVRRYTFCSFFLLNATCCVHSGRSRFQENGGARCAADARRGRELNFPLLFYFSRFMDVSLFLRRKKQSFTK